MLLTVSNIIDVNRRISRHFLEINVVRIMETASCTKLAYRSRTLVRCHDNSTGRAQLLTVGLEPALLPQVVLNGGDVYISEAIVVVKIQHKTIKTIHLSIHMYFDITSYYALFIEKKGSDSLS